MDIYKIFTIESARSLPNLADGHPCKNVHGHSFKIIITVTGNIQKDSGFVLDFEDIKAKDYGKKTVAFSQRNCSSKIHTDFNKFDFIIFTKKFSRKKMLK